MEKLSQAWFNNLPITLHMRTSAARIQSLIDFCFKVYFLTLPQYCILWAFSLLPVGHPFGF